MRIRNDPGFYGFGAILSRCRGGVAGIARNAERTKISVKVLGDVELSVVDVREVHPIIKMIKIFLHVDRPQTLIRASVQCQDSFRPCSFYSVKTG